MIKIICYFFFICVSTISLSQNKDVSSFNIKYLNWFNKDIKTDKANGTSTYKAYKKLLNNKQPKEKIIVAVIDVGIDPLHEDLKANMWVNKKEIDDNGIDDDNNGYIDDIYGWNFLGNNKGVNINAENLESTRILRRLKNKYQNIPSSEIKNKEEYKLYLKLDKEYWENRNKSKKEYKEVSQLKLTFDFIYTTLETEIGHKITTIEDVKKIKTDNEKLNEFKDILTQAHKEGLTRKEVNEYYKQTKSEYKAHYNINFNPRSKIIGDDITNINDNKYGNSDVKGEDSFHGTFCAGIIGAIQNNKLGIDGIANYVEIMALRAVPDGDEYDKDIALSIRYAVDNGAKIINMSFGKNYSPQKNLVDDAIKYAETKGVLLIQAAGNDAKNIDLGGNFPTDILNSGDTLSNLITVGASSIYKNKKIPAKFSNYGEKNVDVFAPGVAIISLAPNNNYDIADGTSFAAPVVTGVAALIWSYYPKLTYQEVKFILISSASNYHKKCVILPREEGERKKRIRFKKLSASGGIVNTYSALRLAKEINKL